MPKIVKTNSKIQWITGAIKAVEEKAENLTLAELTENPVGNIIKKFGVKTRHRNVMKKHPALLHRIGKKVLSRKIDNAVRLIGGVNFQAEPNLPADDDVISIHSNDDNAPVDDELPVGGIQVNDEMAVDEIPGLDRESFTPSSLASLPSRPMSTPSSGNPEEAGEIFCYEPIYITPGPSRNVPMEPTESPGVFQNTFPVQNAAPASDMAPSHDDAIAALDYSDANIGVGIEDRVLAEHDRDEAERFIDSLLEDYAARHQL